MTRPESEFDDFAELSTLLLTWKAWKEEPESWQRWVTFTEAIDDASKRMRRRLAPLALVRE